MEGNGKLPAIPLPSGEVEIGGQRVTFRALSRARTVELSRFRDADGETVHAVEAERFIVAHALGVSEEEAGAWLEEIPAPEAQVLMEAIAELSGIQSKA